MSKGNITEFDDLEISELLQQPTTELIVAIFIKVKQTNGKVRWHEKFIWGLISTIGLGIAAAVIIGIINYCFG
jgi:hypothetical protein